MIKKEQSTETRPCIDLRVDFNENPGKELKSILSNYKELFDIE